MMHERGPDINILNHRHEAGPVSGGYRHAGSADVIELHFVIACMVPQRLTTEVLDMVR